MSAVAQFLGWVVIVGALACVVSVPMSTGTLTLCVLLAGVGAAIIVWARRPPIDPRLRKADLYSAALEVAVRYGHKAIVEKLVAAEADVNREHMGTTPLREAILHGQGAIARFLIDHGAEPRALNHFVDPSAEDLVTKLFYDGEAALAQQIGKAVTGVHIPQLDGELLAKSQRLGSLFLALAAQFKHEEDLESAQVLYEWKIDQLRKADKYHPHSLAQIFDPSAEDLVTKLFYDGEAALAQQIGKAVTGVHIPQPDGELLAKSQRLSSLFLALAAQFKREEDLESAQVLYEWKIEQWRRGFIPDWPYLEQMSGCLRALAEIKETQGHPEDALRLCRKALQILAWALSLEDDDMRDVMVLDEDDPRPLFAETWLQHAIGVVSADDRAELVAVLRNCERLLRKVDPSQVGEQPGAADRVAAALQRLEN